MWKEMESRVTRRRSMTKNERDPEKQGRRNIRPTDEEQWLNAGMYDNNDDDNDNTK